MELVPTTKKERIQTLDLLRGISLLGILLVNILAFNYPMIHVRLTEYLSTPADLNAEKMLTIFIQGSFYPLFAWLFGYGLQMQMTKANELGQNFIKTGSRRLAILLVIGLLHAFLIWFGDILIMYAVMGFLVLLMLKLKPILKMIISVVLFSGFTFLMIGIYWLVDKAGGTDFSAFTDIVQVKSSVEAYGNGSWMEAFNQRLSDLSIQLSPLMWFQSLVTILPFMLAGAAASQWKLIENAKKLKVLWSILLVVGISVGLFLKFQIYDEEQTMFGYALGTLLGAPILTIGYTALIVLLACIPNMLKILTLFQLVGRMSMTTYLMQSIIQSLLFYGFGLGLYGTLSIENLMIIAIAIFIIQIIFAWVWLSKFNQGPVEMVWKRLTYGKSFRK